MRKKASFIVWTTVAMVLLSGCGVIKSQFREPSYTQSVKSRTVLRQYAADVWHSIKKHWVRELQLLIRAKLNMADVP